MTLKDWSRLHALAAELKRRGIEPTRTVSDSGRNVEAVFVKIDSRSKSVYIKVFDKCIVTEHSYDAKDLVVSYEDES